MKNPIKTLLDALPDKTVEIRYDAYGAYMVEYSNGLGTHPDVKDGYTLRGTTGRGSTIEEAVKDYIQKISGKELVFDYSSGRRETIKVAFIEE